MIQASGCAHDPLQVLNFHVLGLFIRLRNYTEYNEVKYCLKVGGQHQGKGKLKIRKKSAARNKIANQMVVSCWFFGNLGVSNNVFFISFSLLKILSYNQVKMKASQSHWGCLQILIQQNELALF